MIYVREGRLYFPDGETHFTSNSRKTGRPAYHEYQATHLAAAYPYVADWSVAVDVGAHVGLLTRQLAKKFERVIAFEPGLETYECLVRNTEHLKNVTCVNAALGATNGQIGIEPIGENSGDRQVVPGGAGVRLMTLDSYPLDDCGLLKMDVQGYEYDVLVGAQATVMAFAPVIIAEDEPPEKLRAKFTKQGAVAKRMADLEAEVRGTAGADVIYAFGPDGAKPYTKYAERGAYHWAQYESGKMTACVDGVVAYVNARGHRHVLDVGCGDGLFTVKLDNTFGVDNNTTAIKLAHEHLAEVRHMNAYRIAQPGAFGVKFDAVFLADCLEHLSKPVLMLDLLHRVAPVLYVLNPVPNGSRWHITEFTDDGLIGLATELGWRLVHRQEFEVTGKSSKTLLHFTSERR